MIMAFDFSCPACRHTMEMDNSAAGEMGVCPKCDAEVLIQRGTVDSEPEEPLVQDEEQLSQTSSASVDNQVVELGTGTTIATRIVMIAVFLCIMSGGGYMIFNGFEIFGYQYKGIEKMLENAPEYELSEHQKKLIEESKANQGPPDYSHLAVEPLVRTDEEIRADEAMGAGGGDFDGASADGGEDDNRGRGGLDSGRPE
jgi:Zn-finger nucleic acid-binding protein